MGQRTRTLWVIGCVVWAVGGCWSSSGDGSGGEEQVPTSFEEVRIPAGFTFEMARPITLELEVDAALRQVDEPVVVEVRRPGRGVVYRSTIPAHTPTAARHIQLPLPLRMSSLEVRATGTDWSREGTVSIGEDGIARYTFR